MFSIHVKKLVKMEKKYIASIILLSLIIMPLFSATTVAQKNPLPILPSIPGYKPKVEVTVDIGGEQNTLHGSVEYIVKYPENTSGEVTGNGELVFNETNLYFTLTVKGDLQTTLGSSQSTTGGTGINADGSIKGNITGTPEELHGKLNVVFNMDMQNVSIHYNVPLEITIINRENKTITKIYTENAQVNVMGNQSKMTANYTSVTEPDKITNHVYIKAEASDMQTLFMTIMPILALSGTTTPPMPQFSGGKWYVEYENTSVIRLNETERELMSQYKDLFEKYNISVESIDGSIDGNFNMTQNGNVMVTKFNLDAYLLVKGDFSKGIPLDPEANTVLRKLTGTLMIDTIGGKILVKGVGDGLFDAIDPYLVQGFFNTQVPSLLMDATDDSYAKIVTHNDIKLVLNDNIYTRLVFTKQNASEARNLRLMVNGTVLEPVTEPDVMVYEQYEHTNRAYVAVTNETRMAIVKLTTANATNIRFYGPVGGKKIVVEFRDGKIEIEFSDNAKIAGQDMVIEKAKTLLKGETPIPDTYKKLSDYYYIETTLESGSIRVKLPFNTSMLQGNEQVLVAHWTGSEWEYLEPLEVNMSEGYVEVELTHLSPLAVVAQETETTTTTTTTQTTTQPTTTTTTTTTSTPTTTTTTTTQTTTTTSPTTTTQTTTTQTATVTTTTTTQTTTTTKTTTTTTQTTSTSPTGTTTKTTPTQTQSTTQTTSETTSKPTTTQTVTQPTMTTQTTQSTTSTSPTSTPTQTTSTPTSPATTQTTTQPEGGLPTTLIIAVVVVVIIAVAAGVFFMKK